MTACLTPPVGPEGADFNRLHQDNPMTDKALTIGGLETVYDALATAIDQAGADKAQLFLVKLALLNAKALADENLFQEQIKLALQDL
jgi:hypothetical protein